MINVQVVPSVEDAENLLWLLWLKEITVYVTLPHIVELKDLNGNVNLFQNQTLFLNAIGNYSTKSLIW